VFIILWHGRHLELTHGKTATSVNNLIRIIIKLSDIKRLISLSNRMVPHRGVKWRSICTDSSRPLDGALLSSWIPVLIRHDHSASQWMHSESIQSHSGADPNHIHCLESTPYPEKQTSQRHLGSSVSHISDTHTHTRLPRIYRWVYTGAVSEILHLHNSQHKRYSTDR